MASAPNGASQRLLTMKFMQRAAAAQAPVAPSITAPDPDDTRPRKRTKLRGGLNKDEKARFVIDQKAAQAALEDEDRKRQAAMDRMAERMGDSHWVLDTTKLPSSHKQAGSPLKIVQVGFSEIDKRDIWEEAQQEKVRAFQSYGPKKKAQKAKKEKDTKDSDSDSSSSGSKSDSDSDSSNSDSSNEDAEEVPQSRPGRASFGTQKRDELKRKRRAERAESSRMASERKTKDVKLHKLTSISGGGAVPLKRPGPRR